MAKWLTKSDYLKFLIHPAYLWIAKYAKSTLPEFNEIGKAYVEQGHQVEAHAARLWPQGVTVDVPMFDGPAESATLMADPAVTTLFQPSVLSSRNLYVRSDILIRDKQAWNLYEVKGSGSVKTAHLLDLAFQRYVWEESGITISKCFVAHINTAYVRDGDIDPKQLFTIVEVTSEVELLMKSTAIKVTDALKIMELPNPPDDAPEFAGEWYGYRDVYRYLHPDIAPQSIYNLTRLTLEQIKLFSALNIHQIGDIPDSLDLKPEQVAQIEVTRSGHTRINESKISASLAPLKYPLYFLDYETFASAIPLYNGIRPFEQLPFQYSLDVIEQPGSLLVHREYLAQGQAYPLPGLLASLQADMSPVGSVIVWNKAFEMGCNDAMAALHPEFTSMLGLINDRIYDLMEIFSNGWYVNPGFMGSASLKKVLPVIAPELSYKELGIGEGLTAQIRWMKAARGELTSRETNDVYQDLMKYCGQDTLAMVKIFEHLKKLKPSESITGSSPPPKDLP